MEFDALLKLVGNDPLFRSSLLLAGNVNPKLIRIRLVRWGKNRIDPPDSKGNVFDCTSVSKKNNTSSGLQNRVQKASSASLQTVLAFSDLILEAVNRTTSVSIGRRERLKTPLGIYEFRRVKPE